MLPRVEELPELFNWVEQLKLFNSVGQHGLLLFRPPSLPFAPELFNRVEKLQLFIPPPPPFSLLLSPPSSFTLAPLSGPGCSTELNNSSCSFRLPPELFNRVDQLQLFISPPPPPELFNRLEQLQMFISPPSPSPRPRALALVFAAAARGAAERGGGRHGIVVAVAAAVCSWPPGCKAEQVGVLAQQFAEVLGRLRLRSATI